MPEPARCQGLPCRQTWRESPAIQSRSLRRPPLACRRAGCPALAIYIASDAVNSTRWLTQDPCLAVAGGQHPARAEALRREVPDAPIHLGTHDQGRDVRAQRWAEFEAVAAGARVDEDPGRDLADHRHPVRADV